MTREQFAHIEMLGKVAGFAKTYDSRIPAESLARAAFEQIEAARATIGSLGALPSRTGTRPGTSAREEAGQVLRADLNVIHQTMLAVAIDHPEITPNFRLPPNRRDDQRLIRAAQEFIKHGTPLKDAFIAHQLAPDFLEKLASEIEALVQAINAQARATSERNNASNSLIDALADASVALQRLDAVIENTFRDDNEVLTAWKTARDVKKPRERRRTAKPHPTNGNSETSVPVTSSESSPALLPHPSAVPEQPAVSSSA